MGAMIWSGTLTSSRYSLDCPECGNHRARPDCDSLGRSVIVCGCRSTPIPMPTCAPLVQISLGIISAARARRLPNREGSDLYCARGCGRRCGPKAKHCNVCAPIVAATPLPCPEPGCKNTRSHKQHRCDRCQRVRESARWCERYELQKKGARGAA